MDRIRNARHFASRLQRWLESIGGATQEPTLYRQMQSIRADAASPSASPSEAPSEALGEALPTARDIPLPLAAALLIPATVLPLPLSVPPPLAPLRQVQLGPHRLDYELRRSTRRSIGFMIDDTGLRVTAPKRITLAEIDHAIRAKQSWILAKLNERRERRAQHSQRPPQSWDDGALLPYLGGTITLRLHQAARHRVSFDSDHELLHLWLPPISGETQLKEKVRAWMQQQARDVFAARLDLYAAKLGVTFHSFALSSAGTRWGSCTAQRTIRLNWRLIHFPLPLLDYVVAHELSHLVEMNHSPRFWATLESIYPDCDGARQALRKRALELPPLFG